MIGAKASQQSRPRQRRCTFSGALAWPYLYPWPQRPAGLIEEAFDELGKRWKPILDAYDEPASMSATRSIPARTCSTAPPSRCSSTRSSDHTRCNINYDPSHFLLQQLDYLDFIDIYHERIKAFHVKDAEFNPTGRQGVYSGYQGWVNRAGRFRSLGDGQVDFGGIFSKLAAVRLRQLGGARMGMLPEASRGRRRRRRAVHRRPHHPGHREGVRRFRRRHDRQEADASAMLGI